MSGYLTKVKTKIPYSNKEVDINVNGKTLILTGGNGCGKTQLMRYVFNKLKEAVIDRNNFVINDLERDLATYQNLLMDIGPAHQNYDFFNEQVCLNIEKINEVKNPPVQIREVETFVVKHSEFKAVLTSFEAMRKSEITKPSTVTSLDALRSKDKRVYTKYKYKYIYKYKYKFFFNF